jgi:rhodanese-related sulfurtransferase
MRISAEAFPMVRAAVLLLLAALVPTLLAAWLHPKRPGASLIAIEGTASLSVAEAREKARTETILWVDARRADAYAAGHIPRAINLREDAWEELLASFIGTWQPGQSIVVYCDGGACAAARSVAVRLRREFEIEQVWYLQGGWEAWQRAVSP